MVMSTNLHGSFLRIAALIVAAATGTLVAGVSPAQAQPAEPVELVESAPEGTDMRTPATIDTMAALLDLIRDARRSTDLLGTLPADAADSTSAPLLQAIRDAARRGVKVRILLDTGRSKDGAGAAAALGAQAGLEVRRVTPAAGLRGTLVIVDGRKAYIGSARLERAGLTESHELGVMFTGRLVDRLERVFEHDWTLTEAKAAGREPQPPDYIRRRGKEEISGHLANGPVLAVSPPMGGQLAAADVLLTTIDRARRSIILQGPVFSTAGAPRWTELRDALSRAAQRNVTIRMTVSDRQLLRRDGLDDAKAIARLPGARVRLTVLPQPAGGCVPDARFDNASYLVIDGETSWVGAGGWTAADLFESRSLAYVSLSPDLARKVTGVFEATWSSASAIRVDDRMRAPAPPDVSCTGRKGR
jgi:phospholipase D3/4